MDERTPFVFEIPEGNYDLLCEKFEKMIRRSRKNNLQAPKFAVIHEAEEEKVVSQATGNYAMDEIEINLFGEVRAMRDHTSGLDGSPRRTKWVKYYYVTVEGQRPRLDGWEFVATIDHTEQDAAGIGNLIKSVPGTGNIAVEYRTALPLCHHCHTARRRLETFILRKSDDPSVFKQVGRNCLQDFFPGRSPEDVARQLEWWTEAVELASGSEDEDFFGGGFGCGYERYGLETVLLGTQAAIEAYGWLSRSKARDMGQGGSATADLVSMLFQNPKFLGEYDKKVVAKVREHLDEERQMPMVEAAIDWVRGLSPAAEEDYLYNLWAICRHDTVRADRMGLVCSLLPAHRRFLEGERVRAEVAKRPPSQFVGEIGQRALFEGCLLRWKNEPTDNGFGGTSTLLSFVQGEANVLKTWSSNAAGFEQGEVYDIVGTPKKHDLWTSRKTGVEERQTVLTRVAIATDKDRKRLNRAKKEVPQ